MPAPDLTLYKVAASEVSSATKFNNLVQAIQDEFGRIDPDQIPGYPLDATKFLRGDGAWALPFPNTYDRGGQVDVANSVAEASLYSKSIAGGDLSTNRRLRLVLLGDILYNNNVADTLRIRAKLGATTAIDFTTGATNATLSATRKMLLLELVVGNVGAANSQWCRLTAYWFVGPGHGSITTGAGYVFTNGSPLFNGSADVFNTAAEDTSLAKTVDLTAQWSAASANNSVRTRLATLEVV